MTVPISKGKTWNLTKGTVSFCPIDMWLLFVWKDKKPIYFVTSAYVDSPLTQVTRYDATEHRKVPVPCPKYVKCYNQYMGGTDKNDQMTRLEKSCRHYKWPHRLMMKFFMWATYNAYVLMGTQKPHSQTNKRMCTCSISF